MAGQFLEPSNDKDVVDIQDKAIEMQFTKHGEMFSAKNMAKLAATVFNCEAEKVKGSHEILNNMKTLLKLLTGMCNCAYNFLNYYFYVNLFKKISIFDRQSI